MAGVSTPIISYGSYLFEMIKLSAAFLTKAEFLSIVQLDSFCAIFLRSVDMYLMKYPRSCTGRDVCKDCGRLDRILSAGGSYCDSKIR